MAIHSDPHLRVYAVWLPVLRSDFRWLWRPILTDPRVTNFWDGEGEVGRWFLANVTHSEGAKIEWDAYFVYPPGALWNTTPAPLLRWGGPVHYELAELQRALLPLLQPRPRSPQ